MKHNANKDSGLIVELVAKLTALEQLIQDQKNFSTMLPVQKYLTEILILVENDTALGNLAVNESQHKTGDVSKQTPKQLGQLAIFAQLKKFQKRHDKMMKIRKEGEDKARSPGGIGYV